MKLRIPQQFSNNEGEFPQQPRKFKKWLSTLPQTNMGEITRLVFAAIRELNRSEIPAKQRLEILEMLREHSRSIFDNLKKYFINRTFPLPEKSRKIVSLNQALLHEMATGYKIIVQQAADQTEKIDKKTCTTAILRAISYQSELFLRASEVYASIPVNTWHDTHQLFDYARNENLHQTSIADDENPNNKSNIEDAYKHMLLFSLSRPSALRQSDSERVYTKLFDWAMQSNLAETKQENQINRFFCVRLEQDRPPSYLTQEDCDSLDPVYTLETAELVDNIRKEINASQEKHDQMTMGNELSVETLKSLSMSWGIMPKRRFSRAGKNGQIAAAIGLASASKTISKSNIPEAIEAISNTFDSEDSFSLESIPEELKAMHDNSGSYMTHTEIGSSSNDAWDMVAKGKVLTNSYAEQRQRQEEKTSLKKEDDDLHWEVVNVSAGGYCLRWNSANTSKAQIGEIIALREQDSSGGHEWRIGVIRWMQFTAKNGLEIGVQVLSPKVISAQAKRFNRADEAPFDVVMIPGIRPLKQAATIILPAHAFRTGDKLKIDVFEQNIQIILNDKKEHTGSFTQFQFSHIEDKRRKKVDKEKQVEIDKNKDDFDEIWSSL